MLLYEPPPTQGDLHFRLFGFPVRVSPFFWLTTILFGFNAGGPTPPLQMVIWIGAVLVSILIHELGHAFLQRYFGGTPRITLHAMGGMAACDSCDRRPSSQILISLAGPAAGFFLAALVAAALTVAGYRVGLVAPRNTASLDNVIALNFPFATLYWTPLDGVAGNLLVAILFQINILWGLVNLLPVYPLDGGRIAREVCTLGNVRRGIILSLRISLATAAAMAAVALLAWGSFFTALMFGYLAYASFRTLQAYQGASW